jgi:hypothetical protein
MDEAYGHSSVWDDGGRAMPAAQAGLAALKPTGATAKVSSVGRVMAPACEFAAGEASMRVLGEMWLPEQQLSSPEGRVASLQGIFVGSSTSERGAAILFGTTIATATVDWSASGSVGALRRPQWWWTLSLPSALKAARSCFTSASSWASSFLDGQ